MAGTWTALGANPVVNEVTLCTQPPNLQQCGAYGPASGRISSLVLDPTNANTVLAGSAGGGVWKSTNAGASWSPLTDTQASLAIGALGISANGLVIYAGTGEDNRSDSQIGQGILVSTDGGTTWTLTGQSTFANHYVGGIMVDRANSNHALAATDLGLYETGNAGATWVSDVASYQSLLSGFPSPNPRPNGGARQIIQDPSNVNTYWLSVSDDCFTEGGDILRSTNNGANWTNVTPPGFGSQASSRMAIGVGTGGIAYVSGAGCSGNLIDLEATLNGGSSWTQLFGATEYDPFVNPVQPYRINRSSPGLFNYFNANVSSPTKSFGQGGYDNAIAVDPTSPGRAIFGGITALTTRSAGGSFTEVGVAYQLNQGIIHPDYHAFAFWSHDHLYAGTDGGVYKTNDFGGSGAGGDWTNVSAGLDTIEYYSGVALDASRILGGAQDNGSLGNFANANIGSLPTAAEYLDGDGTYTAIDPNSTAIWASYNGLKIFKGSSTGPLSSLSPAAPCSSGTEPACSDAVDFVAPYLLDSSGGGQKLIAGTSKVYLSASGGTPGTWTVVSNPLVNPTYAGSDKLQALAMTPTGVTGEVMAASRYGEVFVSTQTAGMIPYASTWKDVTTGLPTFPKYGVPCCNPTAVEPNGWFSGITINPSNQDEAWVVVGGLHVAHVWHTMNLHSGAPTTWASIDGSSMTAVPDVPADAIAFDSTANKLYLGTETGIMVCTACSGATPVPAWSILGNLPNVKVNALSFTLNNELVAWTHGRGAWALFNTTGTPALFASPTTINLSCVRGTASPPGQSVTLSNKGGSTLTWSVTPSSGITVTPAPTPIAAGASTVVSVSVTQCPSNAGLDPNPHSLSFSSNGGSPVVPVAIAATYRGQYTAVPPFRILDTRPGGVQHLGALGPGGSLIVQVAGYPGSGIPAMNSGTPPSAAVINVAVTDTTGAPNSYLLVYPGGTRPTAANLNWNQGQTVGNLVEAALNPADGTVTVYNAAGSADVIFDVQGWVSTPGKGPANATAGLYNPLVPGRIMDTRDGTGGHNGPLTQGQIVTLQVGGSNTQAGGPSGVPASGASAVVLNLAATGSTAPGDYLTLWPSDADATQPTASNLNFAAGETKSNRVVVKLGATGAIKIYNAAGSTQVIIDVNGWFSDGVSQTSGVQFTGVSPKRLLDTRDGTGGYGVPLAAGGTLSLIVAGQGGVPGMDSPAAPSAVVMNVVATGGTSGSFFTVYPSDAQLPVVADLNWPAGATIPNLVVVKLSPDGRVNIYNPAGSVDVIADLVGWYN